MMNIIFDPGWGIHEHLRVCIYAVLIAEYQPFKECNTCVGVFTGLQLPVRNIAPDVDSSYREKKRLSKR